MARAKGKFIATDFNHRIDRAIREIKRGGGPIKEKMQSVGRDYIEHNFLAVGFNDDDKSSSFTGNTKKWDRFKARKGLSTTRMQAKGKLMEKASNAKVKVSKDGDLLVYTFEWSAKKKGFDYAEHYQEGRDTVAKGESNPPPWRPGGRKVKFTEEHLDLFVREALIPGIEKIIEEAFL